MSSRAVGRDRTRRVRGQRRSRKMNDKEFEHMLRSHYEPVKTPRTVAERELMKRHPTHTLYRKKRGR